MAQGYDDAADAARDAGVIDKAAVQEWEVRADLQRFLNVENTGTSGAQKLLAGTTEAAMEQEVRDANGSIAGKRSDLNVWEDRWGNVMRYNTKTGNYGKLVSKEDRR